MSALRTVACTGDDLVHHLPDIARLRIDVFRAWPYLYDGSEAYERDYLRTYVETADAMVAICFDGDAVVGASTALPLAAETEEIRWAFEDCSRGTGADMPRIPTTLYLGESVLDPAYRGRGIGVAFFAHREAHARRLGLAHAVFCAVQRSADDPRRPPDYVPLDAFWRKRGYVPLPGCKTTMRWRELGETTDSPKPMQFWHRRLA